MFKKFMTEFKEFALKGHGAFSAIVTALTSSFINPLIAVITGGVKYDEEGNPMIVGGSFKINGVAFDYGAFISAILNFLIIALVLFIMLKAVNGAFAKASALAKKEEEEKEEEPAEPTAEEKLLTEIRDLLTAGATPEALAKIEAAKADAE